MNQQQLPTIAYDELITSKDEAWYLGRGAFSQVYRGYHKTHGDVAIKIMNAQGRGAIPCCNREGLLHLKANSCHHIVTLHGMAQKERFIGLVLEYMPYGSLEQVLLDFNVTVPWTFRLRAASEIAAAVNYLHNMFGGRSLVHCDLKIGNIFLDEDLHAKVGDFGAADFSTYTNTNFQPTVDGRQRFKKPMQYTIAYAAPEVLNKIDAKRTPQMDVYSFSIMLYAMTARSHPFANVSDEALIIHAVKDNQRPEGYLDDVKEELEASNDQVGLQIYLLFKHLMPQCWRPNPLDRMPMLNVRDSLTNKFNSYPRQLVTRDIADMKLEMKRCGANEPTDQIPILQKYQDLMRSGFLTRMESITQSASAAQDLYSPTEPALRPTPRSRSTSSQPRPIPSSPARSVSSPDRPLSAGRQSETTLPKQFSSISISHPPQLRESADLLELEASFRDPYLRQGNLVTMISDVAAIKNAQVGHGGWDDRLLALRGLEGRIKEIENNGDAMVAFSDSEIHRLNPNSVIKCPSPTDLCVGDFVIITLDKDIVKMMQENHGGWVDDMYGLFKQPGLVFRFLQDKDVLVVYKNGTYFRYNPEVLQKTFSREKVSLESNPDIKIGDYVCHDMEIDLIKDLQKNNGGWNDDMADLRNKVGKFVFADYHGRVFIAFSSKLCYVFNPVIFHKLSEAEAVKLFKKSKEEVREMAKKRSQSQIRAHRFASEDRVRVCLPLDIVVELQKDHGGWCYQMLEVYGKSGVVTSFDESNNAQVIYETGNRWTFNPAVLEKISSEDQNLGSAYVPPFNIGDKVRVKIANLQNESINESLNKVRHAIRMLDIPEDKAEILMKTGQVLGIDDDIDVIVSFGDGKNYGFKPEQLHKIS